MNEKEKKLPVAGKAADSAADARIITIMWSRISSRDQNHHASNIQIYYSNKQPIVNNV
jgi:hypothetical protein